MPAIVPAAAARFCARTHGAALFQLANRLAIFVGAPLGGVLVAHGGLRDVMIADALSGLNLCVSPVLAVGLVLRTRDAGWGATSLGIFEATSGVAAAVGALMVLRWRPADGARAGLLLLIVQAAACAAIGIAPYAGVFVAMATIGLTAGLASSLLPGAFVAAVDESYLGRCSSIVGLTDQALMPAAMTGFGALIAGVGVDVACALVGAAFALTMLWAVARVATIPPVPQRSEPADAPT